MSPLHHRRLYSSSIGRQKGNVSCSSGFLPRIRTPPFFINRENKEPHRSPGLTVSLTRSVQLNVPATPPMTLGVQPRKQRKMSGLVWPNNNTHTMRLQRLRYSEPIRTVDYSWRSRSKGDAKSNCAHLCCCMCVLCDLASLSR